eukprot:757463-Hanusia_phi.AAC.2
MGMAAGSPTQNKPLQAIPLSAENVNQEHQEGLEKSSSAKQFRVQTKKDEMRPGETNVVADTTDRRIADIVDLESRKHLSGNQFSTIKLSGVTGMSKIDILEGSSEESSDYNISASLSEDSELQSRIAHGPHICLSRSQKENEPALHLESSLTLR